MNYIETLRDHTIELIISIGHSVEFRDSASRWAGG